MKAGCCEEVSFLFVPQCQSTHRFRAAWREAPPGRRLPWGVRDLMPSRCPLEGREPPACSLDSLFAASAESRGLIVVRSWTDGLHAAHKLYRVKAGAKSGGASTKDAPSLVTCKKLHRLEARLHSC